jgi:hypothetical protein
MKRPGLAVRQYRHSSTHPYYLDLRAFNQGRKFFKTKAEAEAERLRQVTLREWGGREAVGLPLNELSAIVEARHKLAKHGKSIDDAANFYLDHLERIRRCHVTVDQLAREVLGAKEKDGHAPMYLADLRKRLNRFARDFGPKPISIVGTKPFRSTGRRNPLGGHVSISEHVQNAKLAGIRACNVDQESATAHLRVAVDG